MASDNSIITLICDECDAIVGVFGKFAMGCSEHPEANYGPGATFVAVDALLGAAAIKAADAAWEMHFATHRQATDRELMEAAVRAAIGVAKSRNEVSS